MKNEYQPLKGKVTLVTGAGGGIGQKIAYEFAQLGSLVYLCDIRDTEDLANEIFNQTGLVKPMPVICNLSKKEEIKKMMDKITKDNQGVDILINNAAVNGPLEGEHSFPEMSYEGFKFTIDIDLSAAVYLSLLSLPYMKEKRWGRVLFTAAPLSSSGVPAPYLAGKSGFIGLSKYIATVGKKYNIRTLSLVLRHTLTPMIRRVIASKGVDVEEGLRKMNEKSLTGRMTTPEEIAKLYAFFTVADSPDITGVSLLSDGGITYLR
ncbi:MAG: SDR family oxidoreductase [Clostridiales bacterium]|nr:SDR family oxidoreductase [Clostridiales bacterium]